MRRDILVEENRRESTDDEKGILNIMLQDEIDERWEVSRGEEADIAKKPLIKYDEWNAVDEGLYREEGIRDLVVEVEPSDGRATRWANWSKKDTKDQWGRLKELGFYPRREPVLNGAEVLGGRTTEGTEGETPERIDGVSERSLDIVDLTRDPRLTIVEWSKLKACERHCSKEEWRGTASQIKWKTLEDLGFAFRWGEGIGKKKNRRRKRRQKKNHHQR